MPSGIQDNYMGKVHYMCKVLCYKSQALSNHAKRKTPYNLAFKIFIMINDKIYPGRRDY